MDSPIIDRSPSVQQLALTRFRALNWIEDQVRLGQPLAVAFRTAATQPWPDENGDYYAARTLEDWWYAYRAGGFAALAPKPRADRGTTRRLTPAAAAWLLQQITAQPTVPLKVLHAHGRRTGQDLPSVSVCYRFLRRQGLDRRALRAGRLATGPTKAFEAPHVNDLWMVDFSPGPARPLVGLTCHLCVLVDDHSRLIPFAAYYPRADTEAFHHALREAILRRGVPRKLYTDQGGPFINAHSRLVCAQLGIRLLHAKPYHSWSKGKCERLIFTIQQGFESTLALPGQAVTNLADLNTRLARWIQTEYQQNIHSATGASPEARYQLAAPTLRRMEPDVDLERLFFLRLIRSVRKDGTIRLDNRLYEVPLSLRGLAVQLRLDPWRRTRIEVWHQDQFKGLARLAPLHLNAQLGEVAR